MQRGNTLYRVTTQNTSSALGDDTALNALQYFGHEELKNLQDDEDKLEEFINDQPQVKQLGPDKELLITSNKSIAEYNLSMEPRLKEGRENLLTLYKNATNLKEEYDILRSRLDSMSARQSLEATHAVLQTKAADIEHESDKLSEQFLDKQIECDEFLERYMEERTKTHLLKIKSEKLGEMIQRNTNNSTWGGSAIIAPPPWAQTHGGYAVPSRHTNELPYPMYNMPTMSQPNLPPVSN